MTKVYIILGSNIDPYNNIKRAIGELQSISTKEPDFRVKSVSSIYSSPAAFKPENPRFLNAALLVETSLSPAHLKFKLFRKMEEDFGRVRTEDKYQPRPIDIDIVLYGDIILNDEGITIPDPDLVKYAHVLVPILELNPSLVYPVTGESLSDIAKRMDTSNLHKHE